jgi:hypothetical protein
MIEFSQPAQCLFCPQRRKIALLLKLVMAGSAAIITAIILFQPGAKRGVAPTGTPSVQGIAPSGNADGPALLEGRPLSGVGSEVSKRSAEILAQSHGRFQEVQAQVRPLLSEPLPATAKALKLLDERRREVLRTKVLVLGEELFSGSGAAEGEKQRVLEVLDEQLSVLAEQKRLLIDLKAVD